MIRVGLDLMGGDFAPESVLNGVKLFAEQRIPEVEIVLVGNEKNARKTNEALFEEVTSLSFVRMVQANSSIEMGESPTKALSSKPDSSISIGFKMLISGDIDVFASAGNTGAVMVGAFYMSKPIEGVIRPCISTLVPKGNKEFGLLLDVGVNPDCRQDVLLQFAQLGSAYSKSVFNVNNPKVALLNIGSEPEKGNLLTQAAYNLMSSSDKISFVGNLEGYDLFSDKYDVLVCDGFTGNVILKTMEGIYKKLRTQEKEIPFIEEMNYENYGGTPVLGINHPVIVGHGMSNPKAICSMIYLSVSVVEKHLVKEIKNIFQSLNAI